MSIDEKALARQMRAADLRSRRERREKLAEKAISMQKARTGHKAIGRPSRGDIERSIGYAVCSVLSARPEGHEVRSVWERTILDLLQKAGFNRSEAGEVLLRMIETAPDGRERWLMKRAADRKLALLLAD